MGIEVNRELRAGPVDRVKFKRDTSAVEPEKRNRLRRQLALVAVFAALAWLLTQQPLGLWSIELRYYFPVHVLLEFMSVVLVVLVFATVWHTPAKEVSATYLLIAAALFAAGWLDFAQSLVFKDMPDLATSFPIGEGVALWMAGRLMVALTLFGVSFYPQLDPAPAWVRVGMFAGFTALCLVVAWGVFFHAAELPVFRTESGGPSRLGSVIEWLITGLFAFASWRAYRLSQRSEDQVLPWLFGAVAIRGLSDVLMSQYLVVGDANDLLGHAYKFVSYVLFYQAMFVICVNRPYERLTAQIVLRRKSDQILRTQALALDSTVTPVIVADREGKIIWRNRANLALMGKRSVDVEPGSSLFSAPLTPDPVQAQRMRSTVEVGGVWQGLVYVKDYQNDVVILDQTVTPVRDEKGAFQGYVSVGENVTHRKNTELRYKRVLDMMIDGFWIADASGRLREVNEAYAKMSGYAVDELLTMHISELELNESQDDVHAHMEKIFRLGSDQFETRHRHKQGHEFAVDVSVIYDPAHKLFFVFVRDRTEMVQAALIRKALEKQLQQSQKVELLGQLTGGIAHDFNNSLATILGYSGLALSRFVPDKKSKLASYLGEVVGASERARDLIAKMLTFAGTQPSASVDTIAVSIVVHEVVSMMRVSIPSSIELKTEIEEELFIRIDPSELSQMLVNLIINARDAIGGHGTINILVHRVEVDDQICAASHSSVSGIYAALEVSDTGSGIAEDHMSRLFDPFFTTKDVGKGTGLGLSMVQGILRRCDGYVLVESKPGGGSRFELLFPITSPLPGAGTDKTTQPASQLGAGQHVWVVDDEPTVARYLGELLEDWGYIPRLFYHPSHLLAAFETGENEVDLVITDQTMPGLTGLELGQRLGSLRSGLPIILCSGYADSLNLSDVLRHGFRRYFMKPINPRELREALADEFHQTEVNIP